MEVRGRNGKWLRAGDWGAVQKVWLVVLFKFHARVGECRRKGNALIVIIINKLIAQHKCVRGKYGSGSGRRSVDGEKRMGCGELAVYFFFLNIEETSNVLNHLLVG